MHLKAEAMLVNHKVPRDRSAPVEVEVAEAVETTFNVASSFKGEKKVTVSPLAAIIPSSSRY